MRYQGQLIEWNDEKGYGFIQPMQTDQAKQKIFLHIKAFKQRGPRPLIGCLLDYELTLDAKGRLQAQQVNYLKRKDLKPAQTHSGMANTPLLPWKHWKVGLVIAYFALTIALILTQQLPIWIIAVPLVMGLITYSYYAMDKKAAQQGKWRIQEGTLHLLALCGGWCGALAAQQQLRHKTSKAAFQQVFWLTVALNWVLLIGLTYVKIPI